MLQDMDDASWNFYWKAERAIQEECVFAKSSNAMLEIGALRLLDERHDDWELYTSDDLPPVLKLVQLIARRAQADTPASTRGPKRQVALRQWTSSLCDLWEAFGRAVTVDYQAGQASSQTYDFLQRLLRPLDGGAVRYLATVLREERTRRPRDQRAPVHGCAERRPQRLPLSARHRRRARNPAAPTAARGAMPRRGSSEGDVEPRPVPAGHSARTPAAHPMAAARPRSTRRRRQGPCRRRRRTKSRRSCRHSDGLKCLGPAVPACRRWTRWKTAAVRAGPVRRTPRRDP
jgi:hypothetical protein